MTWMPAYGMVRVLSKISFPVSGSPLGSRYIFTVTSLSYPNVLTDTASSLLS